MKEPKSHATIQSEEEIVKRCYIFNFTHIVLR